MNNNITRHPLSDTQLSVYTYCKAHPDDAVYQICIKYGPYRGIDVLRLKSAAESAVNSHPIMKVRIVNDSDGSPAMQRNDDESPIVDILDDLQQFQNTISIHGRLYNIAVVGDINSCVLIICVHHLIFDGYSMNVFIDEISTAYLGGKIASEKFSFFDVAAHEKSLKNSDVYNSAKNFFLKEFPSVSVRTFPPYDCHGGVFKPSFMTRQLPVILQDWQKMCDKIGFSGNVVSTAVFAMVLGCFCGEDEARFSTVFHGRHGKDVERTIGMLVKTIPVSASWRGDENIIDLMRRIRWQSARCMVNDIYPFSEIKKNCGGFADISFVYQGNTRYTPELCGQPLVLSFITPSYTGSSLSMELWFGQSNLEMSVEYNGSKYSPQLVENMIDAFSTILQKIETATTIREIQFLSPSMSEKLNDFNADARAPIVDDVIEMFENIVAKFPSAIAVKYLDKQLTYKELGVLTNRLANHLTSRGIGAGKRVAIMTERSEMLAVLPLAVLKTGAAYVPLSPEYPEEVLKSQLELCNADILLRNNDLDFNCSDAPPQKKARKEFAIFFTSGSTGKPKGVKITHQNVAAYCQWYHRFFEPQIGTVIAAYNNFSFDAFITDVFPALTSGATVAIVPQNIKKDLSALANFCDDNNVNIIDLPTQIGRIFAENKCCKTLQHIVLGGEAVAPFHNCGNYQIYNQYGPTETTVAATIYKILGNETVIPIGKPLDCVKIYVVDHFGRRIPVGAIGEIWIAGAQVADGYLSVDDNANKFIINPFDDNPDFAKVFRTGDFGRWREDGNLEFLGRRDNLVKIRGYRVEMGEIEAALKQCKNVTDAAAATFSDSSGALQIAAYVLGNEILDISKIRAELRCKLPPQMMPQYINQIDALPITPNGKIDRQKLPKPEYKSTISTASPKQLSTTEKIICQAFASVLNISDIDSSANFFDVGGTSISAMQVVVNLENSGIKIKYADIFEHPTAQSLAKHWSADGLSATSKRAVCTPIQQNVESLQNTNPQPLGDIILAGATGYFGAHLLNELLQNQKSKIYCVVRPKDGKSAKERLDFITDFYFGKSLLQKYPDRIQIIEGDISKTKIFSDLEAIGGENIMLINTAAIVKYFAEPKMMQAVNVDAVKYMTDLCLRRDWGFVQISTLSAANVQEDSVPYVKTKWQAEQIALDAASNGLKLKLIRLGNLAPRSTDAVFQINSGDNYVMNFINAVRRLGCFPEKIENQQFDIMPVDFAARDAAQIVADGHSYGVFHVCNPNKQTINEIVDAKKVSTAEFLRRLKELPQNESLPIEMFIRSLSSSDI